MARQLGSEERRGYVLERLELDVGGLEAVPALFVRPVGARGPVPALLFHHSHGGDYGIGKRELVEGREYLASPPWAEAIAAEGWAGLSIDAWVFGERAHTSEEDTFKAMLWQGRVLWGMMVHDAVRALDYLVSRPEVDADRIGTLGMSMGSTMAWWLGALDERVRVVVDICCLTDFHSLLRRGSLGLHGIYYYVPGLLRHFTTAGINTLIAPRPHLALAGEQDELTPPEGLDAIDHELRSVYGALGVPDRWRLVRYPCGHQETSEGRAEALAFLRRHLAGSDRSGKR